MKFSIALLLPALALAQERAKFVPGGHTLSGPGCDPNTYDVVYSGSGQFVNEFATVTFRDYNATFPDPEREKFCNVFFTIDFPVGCTTVNYDNTVTGAFRLDPGVTGTVIRDYVLERSTAFPDPANLLLTSATPGPDYILDDDDFTSTTRIDTANQRLTRFGLQSRVFVQRNNNNANGWVSQDVWAASITDQSYAPTC